MGVGWDGEETKCHILVFFDGKFQKVVTSNQQYFSGVMKVVLDLEGAWALASTFSLIRLVLGHLTLLKSLILDFSPTLYYFTSLFLCSQFVFWPENFYIIPFPTLYLEFLPVLKVLGQREPSLERYLTYQAKIGPYL